MKKMLALMLLFFLNSSYAMETKFYANEEQLSLLLRLLNINIKDYAKPGHISTTVEPSDDKNYPTIWKFTASMKLAPNVTPREFVNALEDVYTKIDSSTLSSPVIMDHVLNIISENALPTAMNNLNLKK